MSDRETAPLPCPCPFCGGPGVLSKTIVPPHVKCETEGCPIRGRPWISLERWNRRAVSTAPSTEHELKAQAPPTFGLHWEIPREDLAMMTGEDVDEGFRKLRRLLNAERQAERDRTLNPMDGAQEAAEDGNN